MKTLSSNAENLHRSRKTLVFTHVNFFLNPEKNVFSAFTRFNNLLQMVDFLGAGHICIKEDVCRFRLI